MTATTLDSVAAATGVKPPAFLFPVPLLPLFPAPLLPLFPVLLLNVAPGMLFIELIYS
jgi:hypothetical protein